jgi:hypothetical protein
MSALDWSSVKFPMSIDEEQAAAARWYKKEVERTRVLDRVEEESLWRLVEQGDLCFTSERSKLGSCAVRVASPTTSNKSYQTEAPGRPHGKSSVLRIVDREDWSNWNRLSFWVYPEFPGFRVISLSVVLHNDGEIKVPDGYLREGIHYYLLKPDQWNEVIWEIDHLSRDQVVGLEFVYRLQGSDVGAADSIQFDIGGITLQQVTADMSEGWLPEADAIVFSHSGYATTAVKSAIVRQVQGVFQVRHSETGVIVLEKPIERLDSAIGSYGVLDFSDVREPGNYRLQVGEATTQPFRIADDVWESSIWKTINFFYCLRCGTEVPGIHGVCHRDFRCEHDGKQIIINGGWHDAGDLSQGLLNTSEAVYAMLTLSDSLAQRDPILSARLKEEARWGLDWVLKTRFGDGYRTTWATMDMWTDGILGTIDDEIHEAGNNPLANFTAAATEALAARSLQTDDAIIAAYCLRTAEADFQFAVDALAGIELDVVVAAEGVLASSELYRCTGDPKYEAKAVELADYVIACQQKQLPDWDVPLRGFFYTTSQHQHMLHFPHRSFEQAPIVALDQLIRVFPEHPSWSSWYASILLYSEYVEQAAVYSQPYAMIPDGVYDMAESDDPAYREQVEQGIPLGQGRYLRMFPVWYGMRGNTGIMLTQAKALSVAARLRRKTALYSLVDRQLEWTVGRNPFSQSLMYGEGYNYTPQYTATSGDICGSLPVGIQTKRSGDTPYYPMQNCYNYKEVWVQPSARWLWLMDDVYVPARPDGQRERQLDITVSEDEGKLRVIIESGELESVKVNVKGYNVSSDGSIWTEREIGLYASEGRVEWDAEIVNTAEPWVLVFLPEGRLEHLVERFGGL